MYGKLLGMMTDRNVSQRDARKLRARSRYLASAAWTPTIVVTTITKIASSQTMKIFDSSPSPRMSTMSGTSAMVGVA
jgi:hypothetical protein